ncbi:MAG: ribonuclease catalytic domain-containing protein [Thermodesulfobacteriota bacterium]
MQGKIVEYLEQGRFICALSHETADRSLKLVNQNGREIRIARNRITHEQSSPVTFSSREEALKFLREVGSRREGYADQIELQEIWELVSEGDENSFSPSFLCELFYGDQADPDREAAFIRAVIRDRFFFKYKNGIVLVFSPEVVEQLWAQAEKEKAREAFLEKGVMVIRALLSGSDWRKWSEKKRCLNMIRDYYLFGNEAEDSELTRELLKRAGQTRPHDPYHLLIQAGFWQKDENLGILVYDMPVKFSKEAIQEAEASLSSTGDLLEEGRLDIRDKPLLTIDGRHTRDFDDALHLEEKDDGSYLVGIHIADVSSFVKPGSHLFAAAQQRGTSVYFPESQIPMLPPVLSEGTCSLIAGEVRPALSFLVTFSKDGEIHNFRLARTVVQVKRRITYSEVENIINEDRELQILQKLADQLQQKRLDNGALIIPIPDVNIFFSGNDKIAVELAPVDSRARRLVAEFMVLANSLAAKYLADREIPGLFRSQPPPQERLAGGITTDLFTNFRQRRFLSRGELLTDPKPHSGVGVECYTTVTSPIRRFLDLLIQLQLASVLAGKGPLFTFSDFREYSGDIFLSQGRAQKVSNERKRYWLLRYLAQKAKAGEEVEALVLEIQPRRIQVVLTCTLLTGDLPLNQARQVQPGDLVKVKLAKVSPLDGTFRIEW